ncbi:roadblock/LC7 domain-containing protein [Streptomyces europaeiscabiei]|uniref:Roadblock/LC7 domain-containing protein n=1 Tax=Streptomyces europaeiscabiei TaxID=146819 RepID=A0ABU4NFV7_9ACTN|nr:roadblock/LC7 domain-containing protein [Streptomyces europaeiscabiei]MDX2762999.1 roadblock/LC7 domain-containing protein [Streptomyces europaeiscabiei]MDX3544549.1 roadblock/LC7 domain-containing protein [Streptomyces europaeiscabiei]MDX3553898.1 roadblock/LC7 domain-containing protein [Streptomyces europaeiscabiei]MDX3670181.1 roadblock/LC7 domain-containing protein [Streptomyces europaeiscabiei]MDX3702016.1 roadblock/LC7 domain-containing protein [Streptomyces europaeiscabiei]
MTGTGIGTTADDRLTWLMEGLLERTPGARHALVLSRDGLRLCRTPELTVDRADQLSAIAAGIQSLSHGASLEFGDGSGGVRSAMAEFHGGVLFIVEAGEGAHLAVVTDEEADAGLVGHNMSELVEQLGEHLSAKPRHPTGPTGPANPMPGTTTRTTTASSTTAATALAPRTS